MIYLTEGLSQQFTRKSFKTINEAEITFEDIRSAADVWFVSIYQQWILYL